jgi:hypothetical protein
VAPDFRDFDKLLRDWMLVQREREKLAVMLARVGEGNL